MDEGERKSSRGHRFWMSLHGKKGTKRMHATPGYRYPTSRSPWPQKSTNGRFCWTSTKCIEFAWCAKPEANTNLSIARSTRDRIPILNHSSEAFLYIKTWILDFGKAPVTKISWKSLPWMSGSEKCGNFTHDTAWCESSERCDAILRRISCFFAASPAPFLKRSKTSGFCWKKTDLYLFKTNCQESMFSKLIPRSQAQGVTTLLFF